jgi:molybdopterin-containing oxidoreductase family iron-sulfur binding subunit
MSEMKPGRQDQSLSRLRGRVPLDMVPQLPDEESAGGLNRRDFLLAAGFAFGGLVSGCQRAPVQESIGLLSQPEGIVAGRASYYASTCGACGSGCGLLVKALDGRPIKLEGNPEHPVSRGGVCAAGQASLLGLYDRLRLQHPLCDGQEAAWAEIDRAIGKQLNAIKRQGGAVRVLSGTITSPTTQALIERFLRHFDGARHVVYDPVSCSAILDAHERTDGVRVLPRYHLDRADVIASFDADFLGSWLSPVEHTRAYRAGRSLTGNPPRCSYHVQVEARLSLTGSKADERICATPEELRAILTRLAVSLARQAAPLAPPLDGLAARLWQARGRSLVLCGSQDVAAQVLCNLLNHLLGNYGKTLDVERPSRQRQGSDRALAELRDELDAGKVAALFILDSNPVYDLPDGETVARALRRVPLVVCCGERLDETARLARYVCPHPHYLESWGDAEPASGILGLRQPTIARLGDTRPVLESLAAWAGTPRPAHDLLREHWKEHVFPRQTSQRDFQTFWDRSLHDGHAEVDPVQVRPKPAWTSRSLAEVQAALGARPRAEEETILLLYPKGGMPDGSHAYNPWLQELPDPISKVTWDNYACLSPAAATRLGVGEGDVVRIEASDRKGRATALELPVLVQPGQHDRVVAVALGYGSIASERFAGIGPTWLEARPTVGENGLVGVNAAGLLAWQDDTLACTRAGVRISKTGKKHPLASTQHHHTLTLPERLAPPGQSRRPIVQETTLAALAAPHPPPPSHTRGEGEKHADLWPNDHPYPGRRWGMVIDLHACTGCSACVIACQAENNIPVVGRDEVRRQREMHWLRIDRYYSGAGTAVEVAHQPMLCQHCERAPCETVCPVLATVHSSEGLNEQVYNRCVGTRYCSNNCPYKVRRFNWFDYSHEDSLHNLVLNPDVTVRSRGVMEKCTFCVQRLQEARIEARRQGEPSRASDVQTACQQSCPAQAIVFGDLNDPISRVARLRNDPRHYVALAELNIGPSVGYLKVVRSHPGEPGALATGGGRQHD